MGMAILVKQMQTWRIATFFIGVHNESRQVIVDEMILFVLNTRMPLRTCKIAAFHQHLNN